MRIWGPPPRPRKGGGPVFTPTPPGPCLVPVSGAWRKTLVGRKGGGTGVPEYRPSLEFRFPFTLHSFEIQSGALLKHPFEFPFPCEASVFGQKAGAHGNLRGFPSCFIRGVRGGGGGVEPPGARPSARADLSGSWEKPSEGGAVQLACKTPPHLRASS